MRCTEISVVTDDAIAHPAPGVPAQWKVPEAYDDRRIDPFAARDRPRGQCPFLAVDANPVSRCDGMYDCSFFSDKAGIGVSSRPKLQPPGLGCCRKTCPFAGQSCEDQHECGAQGE